MPAAGNGTRVTQIVAVIATAIALVPGGAHLLALPAKIAMPEVPYFVAQQVYRGWAWLGFAMLLAILANFASALLTRDRRRPFAFSIAAGSLIAATVVIFFVWTYPANVATGNWTTVTDDWEVLRAQWEYSHAVNAGITFVALICATAAMLPAREKVADHETDISHHPPSGLALS